MDIRTYKKRFLSLGRRQRLLVLVVVNITVIWLVLFFALLKVERRTSDQYRNQYYGQFEDNLDAFLNIRDSTDNFCRDLKITPSILSFLENSGPKDLERCLKQEDTRIAEDDLFISNSRGYTAYRHLRNMVNVNQYYSELAVYNPQNGVSIAVTEGGRYGALCVSTWELKQLLGILGDLHTAADGDILVARSADYAVSRLYIVRSVGENGILLLCGLTERAWMDSLLNEHSGRTYDTIQVCCRFQNDTWLYRRPQPVLSQLGIDFQSLDLQVPVQNAGDYVVLSLKQEALPLLLMVVARRDTTSGIFSENWFSIFLLVNMLWLAVTLEVLWFTSSHIFKPLEQISTALPAVPGTTDELETISQAILHYKEAIRGDEQLLDQKNRQLRIAYLTQLILGQTLSVTPDQLTKLGIPDLLDSYVLVVLYPGDGRWLLEHGSTREGTFRQSITVTTLQELFRRQFPAPGIEFLFCRQHLLVILPVREDMPEDTIRQGAAGCIADAEASMHKHICFGISNVENGQEHLGRACRQAMAHAGLLDEQESGRTETVRMNRLLKQHLNMADLVYLGRYEEAFLCFKEMLLSIAGQKSRYLRTRQLGALLELTFCMLTETSPAATALLESMHLDLDVMKSSDDPELLLQQWKRIFDRLQEFHQDKKEQRSYSRQFMKLYQYMEKNFRNPELSLSMLAEMFHLSLPTLSREFQKNLGQGFLECLHHMRIEAAKFEIAHTDASLKDIAEFVGYSNTLTMTRSFKKYTGTTPGAFRKK